LLIALASIIQQTVHTWHQVIFTFLQHWTNFLVADA
jgi:hypothetical protein